MDKLVIRVGIALAANAVALILAAALLDKVSIDAPWFLVLLVIFTVISLVVGPVVGAFVKEKVPALASVAGLIATWVALLVTDLVSDSIQIEGIFTWVIATLIVWAATVVVQLAGPALMGRDDRGR